MGAPEAAVETALCDGVKARGGWPAKMIDAGRLGAPDRECRFPFGLTIYVETKAKNGRLGPGQAPYHDDLRSLGYTVLVLWTVEQVKQFLADYDRGVYG